MNKLSRYIRRFVPALAVAALILLAGYMCGALIFSPSFDNIFPYVGAFLIGWVVFLEAEDW